MTHPVFSSSYNPLRIDSPLIPVLEATMPATIATAALLCAACPPAAAPIVLSTASAVGTTMLTHTLSIAVQDHAHELDRNAKAYEYELQQKAILQESRRASHVQFLKYLEEGNCGYIENPYAYQQYWREVTLYHPTAEFSLGWQFKQCFDRAISSQKTSFMNERKF